METKNFTIKRFKRGKHYYWGVWKKGRRGFYKVYRARVGRSKIGLTKKEVIKKKEEGEENKSPAIEMYDKMCGVEFVG